ncbi:hypothetical protein SADUNF_Sadunf05G0051100 [Salix dunnii]|uniref:Uncharacterized protein n=1 Tax=Salix dunnii TaxID=1413687 RepID=A0A835KBJ4_9ROSI|nr:hypothetical protein SADUNF_Sadunf05G0051100 [Salix dunnii]
MRGDICHESYVHTVLGKLVVHLVVQPCTKDSDDEVKSTSNVVLINPFAQALVGGASANDDEVSGAGVDMLKACSCSFCLKGSELTDQWRSLFRHMEDMLAIESSQLQAGYLTLKDLKDNCKMDLEMITRMPSDTL